MTNPARTMDVVMRLSELGIHLSIDDFGTGYSSLSYLKRLPVREIKIDKSFVRDMAHDENDAVIVRSTIDLGHNLGLQVVAEGVENCQALDQLEVLGCDLAQGFYMGTPMAAPELERWLGESAWGLEKRAPTRSPRPSLARTV
jgi:diguanylate cyclase